jgi:hypothetical protein
MPGRARAGRGPHLIERAVERIVLEEVIRKRRREALDLPQHLVVARAQSRGQLAAEFRQRALQCGAHLMIQLLESLWQGHPWLLRSTPSCHPPVGVCSGRDDRTFRRPLKEHRLFYIQLCKVKVNRGRKALTLQGLAERCRVRRAVLRCLPRGSTDQRPTSLPRPRRRRWVALAVLLACGCDDAGGGVPGAARDRTWAWLKASQRTLCRGPRRRAACPRGSARAASPAAGAAAS